MASPRIRGAGIWLAAVLLVGASVAAQENEPQQPAPTKPVSTEELQRKIDELTKQLQVVQQQLIELQAQQEALAKKPPAAPPPAKQVPPPAAPVAKPEKAAPAATGEWFVNFGSYARRDTAEVWSGKLDPRAGQVVVSTGTLDGKTLYRVRVVGLASREQAESIARQLEKAYDLPRLWVGRE